MQKQIDKSVDQFLPPFLCVHRKGYSIQSALNLKVERSMSKKWFFGSCSDGLLYGVR